MSDEEKAKNESPKKVENLKEGYQPLKKGYSPTQSKLDTKNPPKGGSGVGKSGTADTSSTEEKK